MKIRLTVTMDVDSTAWADEYGLTDYTRETIKPDVVSSVQNALYGHYGPDNLGLVRDIQVS